MSTLLTLPTLGTCLAVLVLELELELEFFFSYLRYLYL